MLERGDAVPLFDVAHVVGTRIEYSTIWQHRNLVLIVVPPEDSPASRDYISSFAAHLPELDQRRAACVITRDSVPGLPAPGALVADQWGEIFFVATPAGIEALPRPQELVEWVSRRSTVNPG